MPRQIRLYYGEDPEGMGFAWPESREKRAECFSVKRNSPAIFEAVYQCRPGAREGSVFTSKDFCYYEPPPGDSAAAAAIRAIIDGKGIANEAIRLFIGRAHSCIGAWDTAFEATHEANFTVNVVGLLIPCNKYHCGEDPNMLGQCDPHFDVLIIDVVREKLDWAGLVPAFRSQHVKWNPEVEVIEKRGTGITLFQVMQTSGINVVGVNVAESKRARAVNGVGAGSCQGWFRQHRVIFLKDAPWRIPLEQEMKDFSGVKDACDDQVDAMVHLVNYAISQSYEAGMLSSEWTPDRIDELMGMNEAALLERSLQSGEMSKFAGVVMLGMISQLPGLAENPLPEMCGTCERREPSGFCRFQKRMVSELDNCMEYEPRIQTAETYLH